MYIDVLNLYPHDVSYDVRDVYAHDVLYDDLLRDSYKLTNIKDVSIWVDKLNWLQLVADLYIQKWGNYYVIFQKNSMKYLKEVEGLKNIASGAIIKFGHNHNYGFNKGFYTVEKFYSEHIMVDSIFMSSIMGEYDGSEYYITAIFIPIAHANPDLVKYVSDLYKMHSGDDSNISTATYYVKDTIIPRYVRDSIASDIEKVIFNDPATIVFWTDGTKTVVKTQNNEKYDKEMGLAMAISKKVLGNNSKYYDTFKKWIK